MRNKLNRREFIRTGAAAAAGASLARFAFADAPAEATAKAIAKLVPKADSVIHIWLPAVSRRPIPGTQRNTPLSSLA